MDELELKPAWNSGWFAGIVHRPGDDQVTQKVRRCLPRPRPRRRSAGRRSCMQLSLCAGIAAATYALSAESLNSVILSTVCVNLSVGCVFV